MKVYVYGCLFEFHIVEIGGEASLIGGGIMINPLDKSELWEGGVGRS